MSDVYVGPAGWYYKDWEGIVYPLSKEKNFDPLAFLTNFFDVVEINSSFYRPPAVQTTLKWTERVRENPRFQFAYKLWQVYTHQRDELPGELEEKMVKVGLDVLKSQRRLGATLIQFPWSFKNLPENQDWLAKVVHLFREYNPVIEVRHDSWNNEAFLKFLTDHNCAFANIDQPTIGNSIGFTSFGTEQFSYVRLHGRNYQKWFASDANVASRYDYLYSEDELQEIKNTISNLIESSPKTYIIFNNHYRGQAVVNALQTIFLLNEEKVDAPIQLMEAYPFLKNISKIGDQIGGQISLF
jgi:uncharacterized protein YecE (DUF72 family)